MAPPVPSGRALCVPDLECNGSLRLFTEGDDLYDAMTAAIMQAERSIRLESFIFAGDAVGLQFAEVLSAKARDRVEVRFHFDSRGAGTGYSWPVFREMVSAGVKLKWYRPWSWRHPTLYFQRNHRKLLIIDDQELFPGGFNIRVENSRRLHGEGRKRDAMFLFEGLSPYEQLHSLITCGTIRTSRTPISQLRRHHSLIPCR